MGKFLLINSKILPDVYTRVLEAKKLIFDGVVKNATEAAKLAGVSRSAFYKYKDSVFDYNERYEGHIFTLHIILEDRAGVMMQFVNALYKLVQTFLLFIRTFQMADEPRYRLVLDQVWMT